jgi:single-stranded DNA-binding protein
MALPELRGTGRLLTDPRTGIGKNEKPWTSALIKFPTWKKTDDGWEEGEGTVASVIAFEDTACVLARYAKGDTVGVHGTAKAAVWKDKPQLAVTVTQCWMPEKKPAERQSAGAR